MSTSAKTQSSTSMPQAPRKDAVTVQKAQDKESKRARGALSCAECRRLKLKCDKTVPCSSCKRRGCSAICPNGSLITGQGTRFVLADTEKLHQKIAQMSDRIRQLEDALAILNSTQTTDTHPLLERELLKIKSSIELHAAIESIEQPPPLEEEEEHYIDLFGTLAIREDGAATFYGRSAGSESLLIGEASSPPLDDPPQYSGGHGAVPSSAERRAADLPPAVASLAASFPLASKLHMSDMNLDYLIAQFLPSYPEAWRLCDLYLEQAPWFFGAVTKRQLYEEILPLWYHEAPQPAAYMSDASNPGSNQAQNLNSGDGGPAAGAGPISTVTRGGAHDLALLFVIFCFGAVTDMDLPPAPDNPQADRFYQLTKAALTLEPVLERPPSVATVQALALMAIYEGLCSGENSIESTWALMGLATKLAQSIGLHRDCARWKLTPAEVQKRRALFWELFITDCWQSLATGRLATFALPFVDCELPMDPDQTIADDGTIQPSFPFWKAKFGAQCVSAVVQGTLTSHAPKYSIILDLDRKVRDMEFPLYAQGPPPQGAGLAQTMSHFMPTNYRELTLLYIHRCFFAHALSTHPKDPIKSPYAPSFLAGYRSACTIIGSVKQQFSMFPARIARFWVLWTHAFSSAVMLASVVTRGSASKVAYAAFSELNTACDLFESAAKFGGRAVKFLPIIQRLQTKARQILLEGRLPAVRNDIFVSSTEMEPKDELSIFSGQTHTLSTKTTSPPNRPRLSPSSSSGSTSGSRASSDSPQQVYTDNPHFAHAHPSLVNELNAYNAQIQDVYQSNGGVFWAQRAGPAFRQEQPPQPPPRHQQSYQQQLQQQQRIQQQVERQEYQHQMREREHEMMMAQHQQQAEQQYLQQEQQRQSEQRRHQHQQQQDQQHMEQQRRLSQQIQPNSLAQFQSSNKHRPDLSHSHSFSTLHQAYQQQQPSPTHHQFQEQRPQAQSMQLQPVHFGSQASQYLDQSPPQQHQQQAQTHRQHQMYIIPPDYRHQPPSTEASTPSSATTSSFSGSGSEMDYGGVSPSTLHMQEQQHAQQQYQAPHQYHSSPPHHLQQPPPPQYSHSQPPQQPQPHYQHQQYQDPPTTNYQYWAAARTGYTNPSQVEHRQGYRHHYSSDAALGGAVVEDDRSMQETWQDYMYKVGSPRMFDD